MTIFTKKGKLIGSAASIENLAEMISKHFLWKEPAVLRDQADGTYSVHFPASSPKAGKEIKYYRVIKKKERYRFEADLDPVKREIKR